MSQGLSNLTLIGHGDSNVIITDIVAANNATVRADDGNIIGVVAALGIEEDLDIQSNGKGGIFLSNFIMGSGAVARLTTTEGDIKVAAMTANTLFITTDSGEVNLYEVGTAWHRRNVVASLTLCLAFPMANVDRCLLACPRSSTFPGGIRCRS